MSFGGFAGNSDVNIHNADGTTGREIEARVGTVNLSQEDADALNKIANASSTIPAQQVSQLSDVSGLLAQEVGQLSDIQVRVSTEVTQLSVLQSLSGLSINIGDIDLNTDELETLSRISIATSADGFTQTFDKIQSSTASLQDGLTNIVILSGQQVGQLTQIEATLLNSESLLIQEVDQLSTIIANTGAPEIDVRPLLSHEVEQLSTLELYGSQEVNQLSTLESLASQQIAQLSDLNVSVVLEISQLTTIDLTTMDQVTQLSTTLLYESQMVSQLSQVEINQTDGGVLLVQEVGQLSQIITNTGVAEIDTRPYLSQQVTQLSTIELYESQQVGQLTQVETNQNNQTSLLVQEVSQLSQIITNTALSNIDTIPILNQQVTQLSTLELYSSQEVGQLSTIISNTSGETGEVPLLSQQVAQLSTKIAQESQMISQLTTVELYASQQVNQLSNLEEDMEELELYTSQAITQLTNLNAVVVLQVTQLTTINTALAQEISQLTTLELYGSQQVDQLSQIITNTGLESAENVLIAQQVTQLSNLNAAVAVEVTQLTTLNVAVAQEITQLSTKIVQESQMIGQLTNIDGLLIAEVTQLTTIELYGSQEVTQLSNLNTAVALEVTQLSTVNVTLAQEVAQLTTLNSANSQQVVNGLTTNVLLSQEISQLSTIVSSIINGLTVTGKGAAGSADVGVVTVQGIASGTAIGVSSNENIFTGTVVGNVAAGSADSKNPVKVGGVYNATFPTLTDGQRGNLQLTSSGELVIAPYNRPTYSASAATITPAATPTDVFTIYGSATKTIRIMRIALSGSETTQGVEDFRLIKRSATNTGGTSALATDVPHDSNDAAGTATVRSYTANPTGLGAAVGTVSAARFMVPAVAPGSSGATWSTFHDLFYADKPDKAIVLRGTAEGVAINLNSVTLTGGSLSYVVEWTEE